MLNTIVEVELRQVECVPLVISHQKFHSKFGHKQADGWRGVESSVDLAWKFIKPNVFTIVWEDA